MESIETPVVIKDEIEIEEERIIQIKTENSEIEHEIATCPENNTNNIIVNGVSFDDDIEIDIKEESNLPNYSEEITDKPNHGVNNLDVVVAIKDESLISYDYPHFDDNTSINSNDIEALGNVEACLQDESDIKTETEPIENVQNAGVKIETEITPELNSSTQLADTPEAAPKYSFVMKIPKDVMSTLDQIVSSCSQNGLPNGDKSVDEAIFPDDDAMNPDDDVTFNNSSEQNSLLQESDKSENYNLNPFQLNSITGNVLSLEQEAYNILRPPMYNCSKCTKVCRNKAGLLHHLKVHQTIENYENGRIRGRETMKKRKLMRIAEKKKKEKIKVKEKEKLESQDSTELNHKSRQEDYKCTCGKSFHRKTRMEACLRTHDFSESEKFYCMTCLKAFGNKDELALHRKRLHRKKFPCKFCPTDYATRKKLFKHLQIHQKLHQTEYKVIEEVVKGKKKLRCFFCSIYCEGISELKIHVMTEHKAPFVCRHCKNSFPKFTEFSNHAKTYHPDDKEESVLDVLEAFSRLTHEWKCEECDVQFYEADKLALHQLESHSPEVKTDRQTQFQCEDCRRVFISQKGLTSHRRIHHSIETTEQVKEEEIGIMCLECRKICKDMTALTSHMRFHSPDRKYPCKFCDFRFATPEKRKVHAEVHTGDMKFVCFICEYQCTSENRLKKHKQSLKHANMKEYLLTGKPLIDESTSKEKSKKEGSPKKKQKCKESDSEGSVAKSESTCDVCGDKFSSEQVMLEHKQTHPFIEFPNEDKPTRIFFK